MNHYEKPIHEHDICFVDGELVLSDDFSARMEQATPIRCGCGIELTAEDRDLWRVWVLRETVTHQMYGSAHLPVVGLPPGDSSHLCGICTELMTRGHLRPLARRLLKSLLPMSAPLGSAYDQTITEMVLWLMKIRNSGDLLTADEWLARLLEDER